MPKIMKNGIEYGGGGGEYITHTALTTITANNDANYITNNIGTASLDNYKAYILSGVTGSNMFFIIGGDELEASKYIHQHMLASGTTKAYIYSPASWSFIYSVSVGLELYTGNSYFAGKTGTLYGIN